jgi:tetratricopeptide (TPR) repeat protein
MGRLMSTHAQVSLVESGLIHFLRELFYEIIGYGVVLTLACSNPAFADLLTASTPSPNNAWPSFKVKGRGIFDQSRGKSQQRRRAKRLGYGKVGTLDKSMEHYQRALKIDASHRSAHEYLGELYLDMNQLDNAEKQLTALKKACPFFGKCEEYEDLKAAIDKYNATKK